MDLTRYLLNLAEISARSSEYLTRSKKIGTILAHGDIGEGRRRRTVNCSQFEFLESHLAKPIT